MGALPLSVERPLLEVVGRVLAATERLIEIASTSTTVAMAILGNVNSKPSVWFSSVDI